MSNAAQRNPGEEPDHQRCLLLGTAGHIDHGKSALVKALTGTDPDRLREEQVRGMTIVLGFAHLDLPDPGGGDGAIRVGIVDVPGHERFVRTMVAGATGIDLGLLVVAADDGVMPQTREHVGILDLLGVRSGLITISKADLVHADRIAVIRQEIESLAESTMMRDWEVVATSAKTGQGLDEVRSILAGLAGRVPPRVSSSVFRMAIDRVFTIRGRGTVVTGSVSHGSVRPGTTLELLPSGLPCKVREAQSHGTAVNDVGASQRAALNLTGVDRARIERGMELATPGYLASSRYVDARVRILTRREKPLASHRRVRVSMGTSETFAMPVVVGAAEVRPGAEALVQFHFMRPVVASFGQRFIIRNETAQATIGGGRVVRPVSRRLRRTHRDEVEALQRAESGDPYVRYAEAVRWASFAPRSAVRLACEAGLQPEDVPALEERLRRDGGMISLGGRQVHRSTVEAIERRALAYLKRHHANRPVEPGVLRDRFIGWIEKRTAVGCGRPVFDRLENDGHVENHGPYCAHREFRPALSPEDAAILERLVAEIVAAGFDPPAWSALKTTAGLSKQRSKMLEDLARCEPRLILIAPQKYLSTETVAELKRTVGELGKDRAFKLAEVRDALELSRRVVQPMLEYLDRIRFTRRVGDERVLL